MLIARLVAHEHARLLPYLPATREQRQLGRLLRRRSQLVKLKGALKQSMTGMTGLARDTSALIVRMDALIAKLEHRMDALIAAMPETREGRCKLETIDGVGAGVSIALVVIAREIARIACAIHRYHTTFDPQRLKTT